MKFYHYWVRASADVGRGGRVWPIHRYGFSNVSQDDALAKAQELARRTAELFRLHRDPHPYAYADRPLREEIVEAIHLGGDDGDPVAVITRNAYGSLVLNTAGVLFADIDDPPAPPGWLRLARRMLGRSAPAADGIERQVADVVARHRGLGVRLYRTAAGHRCVVTSRTFEPVSREGEALLTDFGSDPRYVMLCRIQECFRARLTPKFWRCGAGRPPVRFPWANSGQEEVMRRWEADYVRRCQGYGTCAVAGDFGEGRIHPEIEPILKLHDRWCCRDGAPLA